MPISVNNSLPSVSIQFDLKIEEDNGMRMLVDTGVAMNLGYLDYHLWVMSQCSEMLRSSYSVGGPLTTMSFNFLLP